jgi:transposase
MHSTTIAVDLAKSVFEVAVSQRAGRVSERRRLSREQFRRFLGEREPSTLLMEACGTAHYWGREARARGHEIVLLPPHAVRRYVLRNKTDGADAKGLLEAQRNEDIRPVPLKSVDQQVLTALHRMRSCWMAARTARLNTLRGLLRELGVFIPVGARQVVPAVQELAGEDARIERLRTIPGVGLLTATALVAFLGDVARFPSGRHLASYLGLTPRERSSGQRRQLGRISKRGDPYLRMLLIHGARSVLCHAKRRTREPDRLRAWALERERACGHNQAAVALANKLARIAWAVWRGEHGYTPMRPPANA